MSIGADEDLVDVFSLDFSIVAKSKVHFLVK